MLPLWFSFILSGYQDCYFTTKRLSSLNQNQRFLIEDLLNYCHLLQYFHSQASSLFKHTQYNNLIAKVGQLETHLQLSCNKTAMLTRTYPMIFG